MTLKRTIALVLVVAAVMTMIGLGIWQLQRAEWKENLLDQYRAAAGKPELAWSSAILTDDPPLFRRSSLLCLEVTGFRHVAGQNMDGTSGYSHIASCRLGAEGPGAQVNIGWSREPVAGEDFTGGPITGTIAPDEEYGVKLVADEGQAGLEASAPPRLETIPNNHRFYAVQWFIFALIAAVIAFLAWRRFGRDKP